MINKPLFFKFSPERCLLMLFVPFGNKSQILKPELYCHFKKHQCPYEKEVPFLVLTFIVYSLVIVMTVSDHAQ